MFFGWLKRRRRRRILAEPFPPDWLDILERNVWQYRALAEPEQAKLRDLIHVMIAEKNWEGCGGQEMTDEVKVTVAAYACLLLLDLDPDSYDAIISILVYPEEYVAPERHVLESGLIEEDEEDRMGEAWADGVIILSWADILWSGRHEGGGINVVIHEFAHELDRLNRSVDGTPPLRHRRDVPRWHKVMAAEYDRLVRESKEGRATVLDEYGATDRAEFFAVASETFFEKPMQLKRRHPGLYGVLQQYYGQDPAARTATGRDRRE